MCRTLLSLVRNRSETLSGGDCDLPKERKQLKKIFKVKITQDLAKRCELPYPGVDLLEFLKFTELPGLLGEQVFNALDRDEDGLLDFAEFVTGFLRIYKGSKAEISQLLFAILDFGHKGFITHSDLRCVLPYLPSVCPKCGKPVQHAWSVDEKVSAVFANCEVLAIDRVEQTMEEHEDLFDDLLEALLNCMPTVFDEAMGRNKRKPCDDSECGSPLPTLSLKPLKFSDRRFFFGIRNLCLYGFRGLDQTNVNKLVVFKDLFVNPVGETEFELKNTRLTYTFEALSSADRDEWVERIQTAKGFRWFDDFYIIKDKIGFGAYGQVLKAVSRATGKPAAVKIVSKEACSAKVEERLRREISILRFVSHPNLLQLYDVFETFERIYIVTELIEGGTLFEYLEEEKFSVSEEFSKKVVSDIAHGLAYLHSNGIVHRDIKLENVLMRTQEGALPQCVIIDFGLSLFLGPKKVAFEAVGTLKYVAPEIISRLSYGPKVDNWSLGVILYILLQGKVPFYGKNDQEVALRILKHKIQFTGEKWSFVSFPAVEVLAGLLSRKVEKRWSPEQVLESEWLLEDDPPAVSEEGTVKSIPQSGEIGAL